MVDTVEALIEQLIDRASGWAQLGYWHIGQEEDIRQALELSLFVLALKNFKEALQMLEHTSFSPNQAKLVAMSKELIKKMKTVDEYFGSEEA
ncbi:hypothetical protein Bca52824_075637 [Brassica carinata]|uniref:Uncharacterized protein n=1 Tax=Brassica carinata TaxID=52824 RepID=A0A8X7PSN4_BRACI|nr:hypothetical protein Bca52824_075637 [Brassica carinata]